MKVFFSTIIVMLTLLSVWGGSLSFGESKLLAQSQHEICYIGASSTGVFTITTPGNLILYKTKAVNDTMDQMVTVYEVSRNLVASKICQRIELLADLRKFY